MTHRTLALVLPLALLGAAGCAADEPVEPAAMCLETKALMTNGIVLNGLMTNSLMVNGLMTNGTELDGVEPVQGVVLDAALETALTADEPVAGAVDGLLAVGTHGGELPLTIADDDVRDGVHYLQLRRDDGINPCGAGVEALVVPGVWDLQNGDRLDAMAVGEHELRRSVSCTSGVIAKCVMWGYDPAVHGAELHQTCTRMARADYCGDGVGHTENGTRIDVSDTLGIVAPDGVMDFEAGWGPDGAVCVSHPRYLDVVVGGGAVYPSCWSELPRCDDAAEAGQQGALLLNASSMEQRSWCSEDDVPGAAR